MSWYTLIPLSAIIIYYMYKYKNSNLIKLISTNYHYTHFFDDTLIDNKLQEEINTKINNEIASEGAIENTTENTTKYINENATENATKYIIENATENASKYINDDVVVTNTIVDSSAINEEKTYITPDIAPYIPINQLEPIALSSDTLSSNIASPTIAPSIAPSITPSIAPSITSPTAPSDETYTSSPILSSIFSKDLQLITDEANHLSHSQILNKSPPIDDSTASANSVIIGSDRWVEVRK